jgi:hypothetical protein
MAWVQIKGSLLARGGVSGRRWVPDEPKTVQSSAAPGNPTPPSPPPAPSAPELVIHLAARPPDPADITYEWRRYPWDHPWAGLISGVVIKAEGYQDAVLDIERDGNGRIQGMKGVKNP